MPKVIKVKTEKGIFRLTLKQDLQLQRNIKGEYKEKKIGILINIGGEAKDCLQIRVPDNEEVGFLLWLESGINCSINGKETRGEKLVHMTNLGITIAKLASKKLKYLELLDNAKFPCTLPDGSKHDVNMTDHDLAFYQMSYYEKRYGAFLLNSQEQPFYEGSKRYFSDTLRKPPNFHFFNLEFSRELRPLYDQTKTWKEFFDKINNIYGVHKCEVIHPWIKNALQLIMGKLYSGQKWIIDISKIHDIPYLASFMTGGLRKFTRKQKKYTESVIEIGNMDWKSFLVSISKH